MATEPFFDKDRIVRALLSKGANLPCPRCGNLNFAVLDGYFNQPLQMKLDGLYLGGPSIPTVVTACVKCGFLSCHALGALGLLPPEVLNEKK